MADERTYIKVHDGIEDHPKTAALSDKAFRLLVTTWGWCSRHLTDGRVPPAVWTKRGTKKVRDELTAAGLVEVHDGHVIMHDYLEHQRSAAVVEEIREKRRAGGRWGSHKRWHVDKNVRDPECEYCTGRTPPPDGADGDRSTHNPPNNPPSEPPYGPGYPETETETEKRRSDDFRGSLPVGDGRPKGRGATGPNSTAAFRLVDETLRSQRLTSDTRTKLVVAITQLWPEATPDELREALLRWNSRSGIGPALLPGLLDDIRKEARGATTRASPGQFPKSATDQFAEQFLAAGRTPGPPELRALPGGA